MFDSTKCVYVFCLIFQWARQLGQQADHTVRVPLHACEHFYIVTKPIENLNPLMPGRKRSRICVDLHMMTTPEIHFKLAHVYF